MLPSALRSCVPRADLCRLADVDAGFLPMLALAEYDQTPPCLHWLLDFGTTAIGLFYQHGPSGIMGARQMGELLSAKFQELLSAGDRDPRLFEPVSVRGAALHDSMLSESENSDDDDDAWGDSDDDEFEISFVLDEHEDDERERTRRRRLTSDALAQREALLDPEIAARALHTATGARILRNRSVAERPSPMPPRGPM